MTDARFQFPSQEAPEQPSKFPLPPRVDTPPVPPGSERLGKAGCGGSVLAARAPVLCASRPLYAETRTAGSMA